MTTTLLIGRAATCDVVLADPTVSRRHAELTAVGPDLFRFTDRGSTSGSYRFGEGSWQPLAEAELHGADRLRLGEFETTVADLLNLVGAPVAPVAAAPVIERDPETGRIVVRSR